MMRLMSDLISYFRDLLVFKAKPDALQEDVDPETQKALAAQSALIENDRLLDLIDQFAQAEGRMKWAPNKKLHFEVAIIKAIQSLNQATLDEVIERLGELRDGKTPAEKKTLAAAPESRAKQSSMAAGPSRTGIVSPASKTDAADPTVARVAESANGEEDVEKIWQRAFSKIPTQKAFVRNSAAVAQVLPSEGRHFILGFSPDQKSPMDILGTATNRKLIETLLREVSGKDWTLKLTVRENLPSTPQPSRESPSENYADDPLIREAVEIFKGEIKR
jgi:DNA polymerase-3 subunit gamma/tau